MTNRQWLESLNDEDFLKECAYITLYHCAHCIYAKVACLNVPYTCEQAQAKWLNEEHKEEENDK
nr:MAG TPA: hypothetical protein [Caudoviricetes sp.]